MVSVGGSRGKRGDQQTSRESTQSGATVPDWQRDLRKTTAAATGLTLSTSQPNTQPRCPRDSGIARPSGWIRCGVRRMREAPMSSAPRNAERLRRSAVMRGQCRRRTLRPECAVFGRMPNSAADRRTVPRWNARVPTVYCGHRQSAHVRRRFQWSGPVIAGDPAPSWPRTAPDAAEGLVGSGDCLHIFSTIPCIRVECCSPGWSLRRFAGVHRVCGAALVQWGNNRQRLRIAARHTAALGRTGAGEPRTRRGRRRTDRLREHPVIAEAFSTPHPERHAAEHEHDHARHRPHRPAALRMPGRSTSHRGGRRPAGIRSAGLPEKFLLGRHPRDCGPAGRRRGPRIPRKSIPGGPECTDCSNPAAPP